MTAILVFWLSAALIIYHYVGFYIVMKLLAKFKPKPTNSSEDYTPRVSLIIAAYNEEKVIADKLTNSLDLDYPKDKLQIIVAADGSSDRTVEFANAYVENGVAILHESGRKGKMHALNRAMSLADGEILLFSDANAMYSADAVRKLVRHFYDDKVGAVCGQKDLHDQSERQASKGEGTYWSIESRIKLFESQIGSITTADGEIFAIRKDLYEPPSSTLINDDTALTIGLIKSGYRVLYEPEAVSSESASINFVDEYYIKKRVVAGGFQSLWVFRDILLNPLSSFSWMFFSHKVLRWIMPWLLIANLSTCFMLGGLIFETFAILQIVFYFVAILGLIFTGIRDKFSLVYFVAYYVMVNFAAAMGLLSILFGKQTPNWRKAAR